MIKSKITQNIYLLLNKLRPINKDIKKNFNEFNFFDSGHLDSFEILKFNLLLEKKFKIKLSPKEITSERYKTIIGLTNIIYRKLN
mgnify:CR=1 FL=1